MKLICEYWIRIKSQALSREETLNRFVTVKSNIELRKVFKGWSNVVRMKGALRYDERKRRGLLRVCVYALVTTATNNSNLSGLMTERKRAEWPAIATESCYLCCSKDGSLSCNDLRESRMKC